MSRNPGSKGRDSSQIVKSSGSLPVLRYATITGSGIYPLMESLEFDMLRESKSPGFH